MADALDHALLDARHRRAQERGNFKPELLLRVRSEHGQDGLLDRRRVISIKGPLGQGRQLDAEESVDVPEDLGDPAGETPLEQSRGFTMPPGDRLVELCCPGRHVLRTARVGVLHWRRPMSERKLHVEAIPIPDRRARGRRRRDVARGEPTKPRDRPTGCVFRVRCRRPVRRPVS
jgi:hypothetical protein